MKTREISHFFDGEYTQQAQYINFSKIASVISGSKVTQQKILSTMMNENISTWQKVEVVSSLTALKTLYLGGSSNIDGVATNLGAGYVGSNNVVLIETKGDFGGRLNTTPAASRYIFTKKGIKFDHYFNKEDLNVLPKYTFEGEEIEYQYFTYNLPMILINGSSGLGFGYSSNILPRNEEDIKTHLVKALKSKTKKRDVFNSIPYFNGFNGIIEQDTEPNKFIISGVFKRITKSKLEILELPIGENYKSYIKKLDVLVETGKIKEYEDLCDPKKDTFNFVIKTDIKFSEKSDTEILKLLKLISKKAENLTLNDENNKIKVFESVNDIFWYYYDFKLGILQERKDFIIGRIQDNIRLDISKYTFIKLIVDNELTINKRKKWTL